MTSMHDSLHCRFTTDCRNESGGFYTDHVAWLVGSCCGAFHALEAAAEGSAAALGGRHPIARGPGRVVPYVLVVPALELRHPMVFRIEMEADDAALHRLPSSLRPCQAPILSRAS